MNEDEFIGSLLSVDCGSAGIYQGKVSKVDTTSQSISLERPLRNGKPIDLQQITLAASDITNLEVIKAREDFEQPKIVCGPKRYHNHAQGRNQAGSTSNSFSGGAKGRKQEMVDVSAKNYIRSDKIAGKQRRSLTPDPFPKNSLLDAENKETFNPISVDDLLFPGEKFISLQTDKGKKDRESRSGSKCKNGDSMESFQSYPNIYGRRRAASCTQNGGAGPEDNYITQRNAHFFQPIDEDLMATDFDFEANLAKFDKKSFGNKMPAPPVRKTKNFRHDQNIVEDASRVDSWVKKAAAVSASLDLDHLSSQGSEYISDFTSAEATNSSELLDIHCTNKRSPLKATSSSPVQEKSYKSTCQRFDMPTITVEDKRKVNAAVCSLICPEYLGGNVSRGVMDCLLEMEREVGGGESGSGRGRRKQHSITLTDTGSSGRNSANSDFSKQDSNSALDCILSSSHQKVVILSGPSKLSQITADYLSIQMMNRAYSAIVRSKTASANGDISNTTASSSQLKPANVVIFRSGSNKDSQLPAYMSGLQVVSSVHLLPKSKETGLVISLWDLSVEETVDIPPLLGEWMRATGAAGGMVIEVDPVMCKEWTENENCFQIFTLLPGDPFNFGDRSEGKKKKWHGWVIDVGIPIRIIDQILSQSLRSNLKVKQSENLSELLAVIFKDGSKLRV